MAAMVTDNVILPILIVNTICLSITDFLGLDYKQRLFIVIMALIITTYIIVRKEKNNGEH